MTFLLLAQLDTALSAEERERGRVMGGCCWLVVELKNEGGTGGRRGSVSPLPFPLYHLMVSLPVSYRLLCCLLHYWIKS